MTPTKTYYALKPFIPRTIQVLARRLWCRLRRYQHRAVWPIDPRAGTPPGGWPGWPEGKRFGLVLTHDVDTLNGLHRCRKLAELEMELGFRSSFNFVPERYPMDASVLHFLEEHGFEIGVHGLRHDGRLFSSWEVFEKRVKSINAYLHQWNAVGFRAPAMHHNLEWIRELNIEYDLSTFDTDPFEPQPDGVSTIFPFWVGAPGAPDSYLEMPYTLPQDFTVFILMQERGIDLWLNKLEWIVARGGLALLNVHPDYLVFQRGEESMNAYPADYYREFLEAIAVKYENAFWSGLPKECARYCRASSMDPSSAENRDPTNVPALLVGGY